jgi:hypothetical protein
VRLSEEAAVLASILAVIAPVLAAVAAAADAASYDCGGSGDRGGACDRPAAEHAGSPDSISA